MSGRCFFHHVLGLNCEALHEPSVLLRRHLPDLINISRPPEFSGFKSFVQKQKSVSLPEKSFQSVFFPPAEKEKRVCPERIKIELVSHQRCKTIYTIPEICIPAGNVDVLNTSCIIERSGAPPRCISLAPRLLLLRSQQPHSKE